MRGRVLFFPLFASAFLLATSNAATGCAQVVDSRPAGASGDSAKQAEKYSVESLRGRVVFAAEAMARLHGVKGVAEAKERVLALETSDGEIYPLVEDVRGRAFRVDAKLREFDVELLVRRYEGSPMRQVIGVYAIEKDGKYEVDYWCDVCAIAMFEQKPCECCQAMNHMRLRKVGQSSGK
ncbi:MAG: hypothetical protein WD875_15530 [Pirellulales bacterium]